MSQFKGGREMSVETMNGYAREARRVFSEAWEFQSAQGAPGRTLEDRAQDVASSVFLSVGFSRYDATLLLACMIRDEAISRVYRDAIIREFAANRSLPESARCSCVGFCHCKRSA